jgi:hypothetical protein
MENSGCSWAFIVQMIPNCGGEYHGQTRGFKGFELGATVYFLSGIGNN